MKPIHLILVGLAGVLVGLGLVFPAVAQWRDLGTLPVGSWWLLLLGGALTAAGVVSGINGARRFRN